VRRIDRQPPRSSDPSPVRTSRTPTSTCWRVVGGLGLTLLAAAGVAGTATASTTTAMTTPTTAKHTATTAKTPTTTAAPTTTAKPSTTTSTAAPKPSTTTKTKAPPTSAPRTSSTAAAAARPATTTTTAGGRTATDVTAKGGATANEGASPLTTPGPPTLLVEGPVDAITSPKLLSPLTKMWLSALMSALVGLVALTMTVRYWRRTTPTAPARAVARTATKATAPAKTERRLPVPDLVDPTIALRRPVANAAIPRWTGDTWEHHHLPT
jgi:hypothetical protein